MGGPIIGGKPCKISKDDDTKIHEDEIIKRMRS